MKQDESRKPVSVEDLLKIKRAERPSTEFWGDWHAATRARVQAVALVKRPWWKDAIPKAGIALARWHVPVGATALAALAFVAVYEYQPALPSLPAPAPIPRSELARPAAVPAVPKAAASSDDGDSVAKVELPRVASRAFAPGEISGAVAMILTPDRSDRSVEQTSLPGLASNPTEPALNVSLPGLASLDDRSASKPVAVSSVASQQATKRPRFLQYTYNPGFRQEGAGVDRQTDRSISRLSEDELYETASSRLGARGDRVSLRF